MSDKEFSLHKRGKYYYAQLKLQNGSFDNAISTRETTNCSTCKESVGCAVCLYTIWLGDFLKKWTAWLTTPHNSKS